MNKERVNEIVETLLTLDGKGREAKRASLHELIRAPDDDLDMIGEAIRSFRPVVDLSKQKCNYADDLSTACLSCGQYQKYNCDKKGKING
jgi:hypothetical protein